MSFAAAIAKLRHNASNLGVGVEDALFLLGVLVLSHVVVGFAVRLAMAFYRHFLRSPVRVAKYGKWAVVTGATDGIGKAFAKELARQKMNVCLISRTQSKLDEAAAEIASKYNVETMTIAADFSQGRPIYANIAAELNKIEVGVLVNNVGVSYEHPEMFGDVSEERVWDIINLNVGACTAMTRIVLSQMVERKRGAIVNVGSASGFRPMGLLGEYSASKAYSDFFSRALADEYAPKGIFIQSLMPLLVSSKLSKIRKASLTVPAPDAYARSAIATLGHDRRTLGYWSHALQQYIGDLVPNLFDWYVFNMHQGLRKRAHKKKAQKKE